MLTFRVSESVRIYFVRVSIEPC